MRTILFFDLPTLTNADKRYYRLFVKNLKTNGFYMMQESVYVKMSIDIQATTSTINKIKKALPPKGLVMLINITEKQFSTMEILVGDYKTDVITSNERILFL